MVGPVRYVGRGWKEWRGGWGRAGFEVFERGVEDGRGLAGSDFGRGGGAGGGL